MPALHTPTGPVLIQPTGIPWPVLADEARMRAETSVWWVPGTQIAEIYVGDGVVWLAELPDGQRHPLSLTGALPDSILAMLRAGLPPFRRPLVAICR